MQCVVEEKNTAHVILNYLFINIVTDGTKSGKIIHSVALCGNVKGGTKKGGERKRVTVLLWLLCSI